MSDHSDLLSQIEKLESENARLKSENARLKSENARLLESHNSFQYKISLYSTCITTRTRTIEYCINLVFISKVIVKSVYE